MKNLFDKNKHRLSDAEKSAIWRDISLEKAVRRRRWLPRLKPTPAFATAAVAVCGLAIIFLVSRDDTQRLGRMKPVVAPPEFAPVEIVKGDEPSKGNEPKKGETSEKSVQTLPREDLQDPAARVKDRTVAQEREIVGRAGELDVRGGRSGEVRLRIDEMAANKVESGDELQTFSGSVSVQSGLSEEVDDADRTERADITPGGSIPSEVWVPPNDQAYDTVYFEHYGVNPFVVTAEDAQSTFAIDVDNASYTVMRRYLRDGHLPPHDAVRVEEYVNYFAQGYGEVGDSDFAIAVDGAPSPFGTGYHLLRIGVQGRDVASEDRRPANLVFVIDISGSMNREDRLELVKRALMIMLDKLEEGDRVGIVVYGSHGRVLLEPTAIEQRDQLEQAIASLAPSGSTNAEEGLRLAYEMARRVYQPGAINRLILCSDGVANQGRTGAESILAVVRNESDHGIGLSTIGFGMGNYNDVLMEKLADHGDGGYYYVDELREAERVLRENLTGTLQTIGKDVKIQVEFDPANVLRYRLIGYENRDVADEDFRNDAVDAGEIGAGHRVTALYEIKLSAPAADAARSRSSEYPFSRAPHLATVRLRYEKPAFERDAGEVTEIDQQVTTDVIAPNIREAAVHLQLAAVVAEYAEILRKSYWAKGSRLADLVPQIDRIAAALSEDAAVQELQQLIRRAADLQSAAEHPEQE